MHIYNRDIEGETAGTNMNALFILSPGNSTQTSSYLRRCACDEIEPCPTQCFSRICIAPIPNQCKLATLMRQQLATPAGSSPTKINKRMNVKI
jgi:hypothetical protein